MSMAHDDPLAKHILPAGGWAPRPYQMDAWAYLERGGLRADIVWHRRSGKDELALHWTAVAAHQRVGTYWHMLPEAAQARKAIWTAVNPHTGRRRIDEVFPSWCRRSISEQEMFIRFTNGSTWQVVGSDNYDSLVGASPVGVVFSEWALANPAAWAFVRPMLLENGGWAIFNTTPRGNNHAHKMFEFAKNEPDWFAQLLTADDTKIFTTEQLQAELRQMQAENGVEDGRAVWQQEYYCSWSAAVQGAIFAAWVEQAEKDSPCRITSVPIDARFPVRTAWDLGMNDATAIWFYQDVGYQKRFLHTYSSNGADLQHYVTYITDWCRKNHASVGAAVLPHDVEVRELGTGRTRKEVLSALGLAVQVAPRLAIPEKIQATRDMLKTAWFDANGCEEGLDALRHYHFERNDKTRTISSRPKHDWSSHYCSAIGEAALVEYDAGMGGYIGQRKAKPIRPAERWI